LGVDHFDRDAFHQLEHLLLDYVARLQRLSLIGFIQNDTCCRISHLWCWVRHAASIQTSTEFVWYPVAWLRAEGGTRHCFPIDWHLLLLVHTVHSGIDSLRLNSI
jgi:hypothetical protein